MRSSEENVTAFTGNGVQHFPKFSDRAHGGMKFDRSILSISRIAGKTKTVKNTDGEPERKDTCENKSKKEPRSKEFSVLLKIQER